MNWPEWEGWAVIDQDGIDDPITSRLLDQVVHEFYRKEFWLAVKGDRISKLSPDIAAELFDTAVNPGAHRSVSIMQRALNLLNRNQLFYPDIIEDGRLKPHTINALESCLKGSPVHRLIIVMTAALQAHTLHRADAQIAEKKEEFRGWFYRL